MIMELDFIIAFVTMAALFAMLGILGMPSYYNIMNTFDFLWLGGGIVAVTTGCVVLTGIPCAILEASYGFATLLTYIGTGILASGSIENMIKGLIFTPISIGLIYIISKLARGGG